MIPYIPYVPIQTADAAGGTGQDSDVQTLSSPVKSTSVNANPYVAYTQLDNKNFRAKNDYTGDKEVGHTSNNRPVVSEMAQRLNMDDYPADHYFIEGYEATHKYSQSQVSNRHVIDITPGRNTTQAYSEPPEHTHIIAYSKTGGDNDSYASCSPYNATGKLLCTYPYTFKLIYAGDIEITKRIDAKSDATIGVGDKVNVTASVETKTGKTGSFAGATDVTTRTDQTTWSSDNKGVATVDANGKVTGVSKGKAKVCARWVKDDPPFGKWNIVDCVTITVSDGKGLTLNSPDISCIKPGETVKVKLNAKLTKADGSTHDLSSGHTKLTFTSSNTTVATVLSNGQVTLKAVGKTTITAKFVDSAQNINESVTVDINVTDCSKPPSDGGGSTTGGACERVFQSTGVGSTQNATFLMPNPSGSISSDNGQFDVVKGIPSSEYLRADARSEEYIFEQKFQQQTGNVIFNNIKVTKTFTLKWQEEGEPGEDGEEPEPKEMSEQETKEITVSGISRPYTYWEVTGYDVWKLLQARFTNYALPNGETILPSNVSISANATHNADVESHVFPAECVEITLPSEEIDGGSSKPSIPDFSAEGKAEAESKIGDNQVENDSATFKSSTIMNNGRTAVNGPTPSNIPSPSMVDMSARNLLIDPKKTNYFQSPSTGEVKYVPVFSLLSTAQDKSFPFAVNNVTVHTPVVIYSKASDDKEHDQRTNPPVRSTPANPDTDRHAFILDRPFTVTMPTSGQHRNITGYGNRDYAKYIKEKQVKFPFDVYTESKAGFYPANTWISIPVDIETVEFFLPVWVPEGEYTVDFRSFAINALDSGDFGGNEKEANVTIPNTKWNVAPAGSQTAAHVATDSIEVDVVGRLYDFHVTDIADFNWLKTFRLEDKVTPTGTSYWVGSNGIDGDSRGLNSKYALPIRHGSTEEGYSNVAVKTGYKFRFDLKTKGNMQDGNDAIRIKPTFYYVKKDGTGRQPIDLYYMDEGNQFIQVGSAKDTVKREVVLNEPLRNVPQEELIANADYYFRHNTEFDGMKEKAQNKFDTSFTRDYLKVHSKEGVLTGPYGWQILNWNLRVYRGPEENEVPANTMVPAKDIVAAEQTWHSEYSIPANTYAVPQGTNLAKVGLNAQLSDNSPIFLRDGYIIVNFDLETIDNGDLQNPRLQYINAPLVNQWFDMEGFARSFTDKYGNPFVSKDGDVVYYHAEKEAGSSNSDFESSVTH